MAITPNFSEMVELQAGELPAGVWKSRVTKAEQQMSKSSNTPMLKVEFTVFGGEGETAKYNNWKIFTRLMLAGKGTAMTKQFVHAAGLPDSFELEDMLGKEVLVATKAGKNSDGTPSGYPEVKAIQALA